MDWLKCDPDDEHFCVFAYDDRLMLYNAWIAAKNDFFLRWLSCCMCVEDDVFKTSTLCLMKYKLICICIWIDGFASIRCNQIYSFRYTFDFVELVFCFVYYAGVEMKCT